MTAPSAGTVLFGDVVDSRRDPELDAVATIAVRGARGGVPARAAPRRRSRSPRATSSRACSPRAPTRSAPSSSRPCGPTRATSAGRSSPATSIPAPAPPSSAPAARSSSPASRSPGRRAHRDGLVALTGDPEADERLADLGPLLAALLADLTPRQREVARLIVVDELRRSEVADHLGVSRATVSVIADRARVRHLPGLARTLASIFAEGARRAEAERRAATACR